MCDTEMSAATACVASDSACSTCFDPTNFATTFPNDAEMYFRASFADWSPTDPVFCVIANRMVCNKFDPAENGESSCCCTTETKAYMQCKIQYEWMSKYSIAGPACEYEECEFFDLDGTNPAVAYNDDMNNSTAVYVVGVTESGGSHISVIMIGVASLIAVLVICALIALLIIFLCCRKKRLAAAAKEDDDDDDDLLEVKAMAA